MSATVLPGRWTVCTTSNRTSRFGFGGGGGGGGVSLARTGFDAWILALIGGAALAGGVGMLALRRRGVLSAS